MPPPPPRHGILRERVSVAHGRLNSDCGRKCGNRCNRGVEANFMKGFTKMYHFKHYEAFLSLCYALRTSNVMQNGSKT